MKRLFVSTFLVGALILPAAAFAQGEAEAPAAAETPVEEEAEAEAPEPVEAETVEAEPVEAAPDEAAPDEVAAEVAPEAVATTTTAAAAAEAAAAEAAATEAAAAEAAAVAAAEAEAASAAAEAAAAAAATEAAAAPTGSEGAAAAKTVEAAKAAEAADVAPAAGAAASADTKKSKAADTLAAAMGINAPTDASGKRWRIQASITQTLGTGVFVKNANQRQVDYGYAVSVGGNYKIIDLLEGRLDATGRFSFDQALTNSFNGTIGGSGPNQFNFRDIRVGLAGRGLYTEKNTGIIFGSNTSLDLPTSQSSQFENRLFRWNLSGSAFKAFPNVGPGTITLSFAEIFRKTAGPAQFNVGDRFTTCASNSRRDDLCLGTRAPENFAFIHSFNAGYTWGSFSFGVSFALFNLFLYDYSNSSVGTLNAGVGADGVRDGIGSTDTTHVTFTNGTLSLSYVLNKYFNFTAGIDSIQEPFIQKADGGQRARFPFFDFDSTAQNRTSFFLSATLLY